MLRLWVSVFFIDIWTNIDLTQKHQNDPFSSLSIYCPIYISSYIWDYLVKSATWWTACHRFCWNFAYNLGYEKKSRNPKMSVLRPPRPEIWLRKVSDISRFWGRPPASIFQMTRTFLFLKIVPNFFSVLIR